MKKIFYSIFLIIFVILFFSITILSTIGIETKSFNNLVTQKINKSNNNISLNLNSIKFKLDIKEIGLFLETKNPNIIYRNVDIPAKNIKVYINFLSLFNFKNEIKKINLVFDQVDIKQIKKISKSFKPSNFTSFLNTKLDQGKMNTEIDVYFNEKNLLDNFIARGSITDLKIEVLDNLNLEKSSFTFFADTTDILIKNFKSKTNSLVINDGDLRLNLSSGVLLNTNFKTKIEYNLGDNMLLNLPFNLKHIKDVTELKAEFLSSFSVHLDETYKIKSYDYKNNGKIIKANFNLTKDAIKNNFIKENTGQISLIDTNINTDLSLKKNKINLKGKYSLDDEKFLNFDLTSSFRKKFLNLSIDAEYDNEIEIDLINYSKKKNTVSNVSLNFTKETDNLKINNINYKEGNNLISLVGIKFKKEKFLSLDKIAVKTFKKDKKNNDFLLSYGKNIVIKGTHFDASNIPKILNQTANSKLRNINKDIEIDLNNIDVPLSEVLTNFKLIGKIEGGKFIKVSSKGDFGGGNFLDITMKNDKKNKKKYLEIYSDITKPLLTEYSFFKGLTGGKLLYSSVIEKDSSNAKLKIENFKVVNAPGMVKLLSLADLGGLADLAEGEGISFDVLEINMKKENNILKLNEILALGPSLSVLMEGYQDQSLTSLRGTLVPAKTLNKMISKIPVIGDIVIPKDVGEGLFGISFKMKGPSGKIKTTINPIRTVTPRFIQKIVDRNKKKN